MGELCDSQFVEKAVGSVQSSSGGIGPGGADGLLGGQCPSTAFSDSYMLVTHIALQADGRLTLMFCAFEGPPMILRFYGKGRSIFRDEPEYATLLATHFGGMEPRGARQIVMQNIDLVQTSCGFAVPLMSFEADRDVLTKSWNAKSDQDILAYRQLKNTLSIDGLPTGMREGEAYR